MMNASATSRKAMGARDAPEGDCIEYRFAVEDKAFDYRQSAGSLLCAGCKAFKF
jgi:hypothetical protein